MKSNYGHNLNFTLFGQSHGKAIGISVEGLPPGFTIDFSIIEKDLQLRAGSYSFNTARKENNDYEILSGYYNNQTTGQVFTVVFYNKDTQSKDYDLIKNFPRGGHADVVAQRKYQSANDHRGSGHFSGRLTTPLVFLGSLVKQIMQEEYPDLEIISHIKDFASYQDISYYDIRKEIVDSLPRIKELEKLKTSSLSMLSMDVQLKLHGQLKQYIEDVTFPVFDKKVYQLMLDAIATNKDETFGGSIESIVINPPSFIGEPFFYSIESVLSSLMYSIPSVKGIYFGKSDAYNKGSEYTDEIFFVNKSKLTTLYNHNGGINGGISNGEDIVFTTFLKPISTTNKAYRSYHLLNKKVEKLSIPGRHDQSIINRVIPVIEAITYIGLYDLVLEHKKM